MPPWIWNSTMPSKASTSTSPFLKGVTRAVSAPLNISLLQLEVPVQNSYRFFYPPCRQYASHLYLGGGDEPYRDAGLPERGEHPRRVARAVKHPRPDDGDARFGQRGEDAAHRTGTRLYARQGDARDVEFVDDTGDRLAGLEVFQAVTSRDDRTRTLGKGALYVDLDPVERP